MPQYRAQADLYLGKGVRIRGGEKFSSDAVPGKNWQPLDAAAEAAVASHFGKDGQTIPAVDAPVSAVIIPDNWRDLHHMQRIKIAKDLKGDFTVPDGKTEAKVADELIAEELARRGLAKN